ncbi:MAG: hypothetical protein J0M17_15665, partial [Planctomycetes bacterium]|nr:hypothetical protein [Planctomycetota bacterium]
MEQPSWRKQSYGGELKIPDKEFYASAVLGTFTASLLHGRRLQEDTGRLLVSAAAHTGAFMFGFWALHVLSSALPERSERKDD